MSFGDNLKKIRQDCNLTQEELAKKIDTSRSNIANYENNKNMPSIDVLSKLSDPSVFKITLPLFDRINFISEWDKAILLTYSVTFASSVYKLFKCFNLAGVL